MMSGEDKIMKLRTWRRSLLFTMSFVAAINISTFAGTWQWIDTNGDGLAACYYFEDGALQSGGVTPDGFTVNQDGAWIVDGIVQQRSVLTDTAHENISFSGTTDTASTYNGRYRFTRATSMGNTIPFSGVDILAMEVNIDANRYLNLSIAYEDGQIGTITLPVNEDGTYTLKTTGGDVVIAFPDGQMTWSGAYYGLATTLTAEKIR